MTPPILALEIRCPPRCEICLHSGIPRPPRLRLAGNTGGAPTNTVRLSPRVRSELLDNGAIAAIPLNLIGPFLTEAAVFNANELDTAPRVVAKGADLLALRIRDLARASKVPVLQAPPLARALYTHTEVDHEIPARLFSAVAQVLAWVYQLRDALAAGRTLATDAPVPDIPADLDPLNAAPAVDRP